MVTIKETGGQSKFSWACFDVMEIWLRPHERLFRGNANNSQKSESSGLVNQMLCCFFSSSNHSRCLETA